MPKQAVSLTWGEIGILVHNLMKEDRAKDVQEMLPELAKAFALAQAGVRIRQGLNNVQEKLFFATYEAELNKQGYATTYQMAMKAESKK